jgi:hypothetical protein
MRRPSSRPRTIRAERQQARPAVGSGGAARCCLGRVSAHARFVRHSLQPENHRQQQFVGAACIDATDLSRCVQRRLIKQRMPAAGQHGRIDHPSGRIQPKTQLHFAFQSALHGFGRVEHVTVELLLRLLACPCCMARSRSGADRWRCRTCFFQLVADRVLEQWFGRRDLASRRRRRRRDSGLQARWSLRRCCIVARRQGKQQAVQQCRQCKCEMKFQAGQTGVQDR